MILGFDSGRGSVLALIAHPDIPEDFSFVPSDGYKLIRAVINGMAFGIRRIGRWRKACDGLGSDSAKRFLSGLSAPAGRWTRVGNCELPLSFAGPIPDPINKKLHRFHRTNWLHSPVSGQMWRIHPLRGVITHPPRFVPPRVLERQLSDELADADWMMRAPRTWLGRPLLLLYLRGHGNNAAAGPA